MSGHSTRAGFTVAQPKLAVTADHHVENEENEEDDMRSAPEHTRRPAAQQDSPSAQQDSAAAQALHRARVLDRAALLQSAISYEFQGRDHGEIDVSVIVVDGPPGSGPKLHKHPYSEVFVLLEGQATFTAGEDVIEAVGGQIVVVPAGIPHRFVNAGTGPLRQVDIHPSGQFITEWLDD